MTSTAVSLAPVAAQSGSGYLVAGEEPFLVQGCAATRPALLGEEGLRRVAARGVTTIRIWSDYYERGQLDMQSFRSLRALAEELGLRILLVVFSPAFLSDI